jgi:branched-chain amino acid transport system substrate-binding protein
MRNSVVMAAFAMVLAAGAAHGEVPGGSVKIGVLSDFSGPFSDQAGKGSLIAAQLAAEDFARESKGLKAEIIFADHQNKPDIGSAIARRWVDQENVAAIVDLPNSGVALAVSTVMKEKNRTMLASGSATSDLTGKFCQPTTVQWALDTWALGNAMGRAITERGGKSWFFVSFDYALGKALQRDTTEAIQKQGGKVLGAVTHPLGTTDFSSYLLQAQASGADVVALGDTGADAINAIKQIAEFNILGDNKKLAALFMQIVDIDALGLKVAQGLLLSEAFYWDLNDSTRAWSKRFAERMDGRMPTINHAATYSATIAYLRAVQAAQTIEGDKVVAQMESGEINDPLFGPVKVRKDGRAIHTMFVFEVKAPGESKGRYDYYKLVRTIPAEQAFRPIDQGDCPMIH